MKTITVNANNVELNDEQKEYIEKILGLLKTAILGWLL